METRKIFRKLVTNQFSCLEDFGYFGQRFAFRTVFSKTTYSYCCCGCSFEHEYLGYLSDIGHINEQLYEKIVKSIVDGQCPHVVKVSREHLSETSIYGIHIASSVAAEKIVKYHSKNYQIFKTGIFKLSPHVLALMKNKAQNEGIYYLHFAKLNGMVWLSEPMLYAQKSNKNTRVRVEEVDCLEMCVQKRNVELLQGMLHTSVVHMGLPKAFEYAMKHKLTGIQEALLDYTCESKVTHILSFAESAIIYNQPKTLDKILSHSRSMRFEPASYCKPSELCTVLMNDQCRRVMEKHNLFQNVDISSDEQLFELIHRLEPFYDEFRIQIKVFLTIHMKLYPKDCSELLFKCLTVQPVRINAVKILLDLGACVNYRGALDHTPIINMLHKLSQFSPNQYLESARQTLELLVLENPDLELHKAAVYLAIQEDARLQSLKRRKEMIVNGFYKTDAKEHGLFGHDGNNNFALNFMGPFLLECGFPVTRAVLLESLERPLHPAEHGFIKDFLDCPRSLKSHCRNALRNHFKGRDIHSFINTADCPEKLKEFVLLETACYGKPFAQ